MKSTFTCILCFLAISAWARQLPTSSERKKTIVLRYDAYAQDQLVVHNKFGQVKVQLWKRPEIQISVQIRAHTTDPQAVHRYLNAVTIQEQREVNQITVTTAIEPLQDLIPSISFTSTDSVLTNYLQVDYTIAMPAETALTLTNQFGNTNIPSFKAPLSVFVQNGNFAAKSLTASQTRVRVELGSVDIKTMTDGEVDVAYGNLTVKSANNVKLNNQMGKLQLGRANELTTMASYSEMAIGQIHRSALLTISYSKGFHIERLAESLANLDMALSYSSVVLPLDRKSNYNFEASMTNCGFFYPANSSFVLRNPSADSSKASSVKHYSGIVGNGSGSKVQLVGHFSQVSFK